MAISGTQDMVAVQEAAALALQSGAAGPKYGQTSCHQIRADAITSLSKPQSTSASLSRSEMGCKVGLAGLEDWIHYLHSTLNSTLQ